MYKRKYRITINPAEGKWYVEVSGWLGWLSILTPIYKHFNSFYEAQEWAHTQGLHEAYIYAPLNKDHESWTKQTSLSSAKKPSKNSSGVSLLPTAVS